MWLVCVEWIMGYVCCGGGEYGVVCGSVGVVVGVCCGVVV